MGIKKYQWLHVFSFLLFSDSTTATTVTTALQDALSNTWKGMVERNEQQSSDVFLIHRPPIVCVQF